MNKIETIYCLENPEKNLVTFASGSQIKYEDIIKDVFGVASFHDLQMMLRYNKSFQDCICEKYGVAENEISLGMIFRVASKAELRLLQKKHGEQNDNNESESLPCPFDTTIRLREGIFKWDQEDHVYNLVKTS